MTDKPMKWILGAWAGAFCFSLALCWTGMHAPLLYDDLHSIAQNPHLIPENILRVFWDASLFSEDPHKAMYRPLLLVSYIANLLVSSDPFDFRVVNIALHAFNALLVVLIAFRLGLQRWASAVAGALFLAHPAGIQPMLYVSARSDTLLAFWFLWAIYWWLEEGPGWKCLAATVCALLTKEVAVVLPLCFLLLDYPRGGLKLAGWTRRHQWPVTIVFSYLLIHLFGFIEAYHAPSVRPALAQFSTQLEALGFYAKGLVCPTHYVLDPEFAARTAPTTLGILCWVFALLLPVALTRLKSRIPLVCYGLALLSLLVVMVMPLNLLVNYRRLYLPCAFFCIFWAWLTEDAASGDSSLRKWLCWVITAATLGQFTWYSVAQAHTWTSEKALWEENTIRAPSQPRPWLHLGVVLRDEAVKAEDEDAKKMHKSNPKGMRGTELYAIHHPKAAEAWAGAAQAFNRCATLTKEGEVLHWKAINNLGSLYFELNNLAKAEEHFRAAYDHDPEDPDYLVNMGNVRWMRGDAAGARAFYLEALERIPTHHEALVNEAELSRQLGEIP